VRTLIGILTVTAAIGLAEFKPKLREYAVSPNGSWFINTATQTNRRNGTTYQWRTLKIFLRSKEGKKEGESDTLLYCLYHGFYGIGGVGVRHFDWSPDSKYVVFDFIPNQSARVPNDGISFVGVVEAATKKGWVLKERGCQPKFKNAGTIEILSFSPSLRGLKGVPRYKLEGITLYQHTLKLEKSFDKRFSFSPKKPMDFSFLEEELQ